MGGGGSTFKMQLPLACPPRRARRDNGGQSLLGLSWPQCADPHPGPIFHVFLLHEPHTHGWTPRPHPQAPPKAPPYGAPTLRQCQASVGWRKNCDFSVVKAQVDMQTGLWLNDFIEA